VYASVEEVCVCFARRALTYPLLRNWALVRAVLADAVAILDAGRAATLRCLLKLKGVFSSRR
jgi:hypothetical protein